MKLRVTGSGKGISFASAYYGTDAVAARGRVPADETRSVAAGMPFTAAGKAYLGVKQLTHKAMGDGLYRDVYGRTVFAMKERYPCFDSYDAIHEKRFYRWWFLLEEGRLTRIYGEDDVPKLFITDDVGALECACTRALKEIGWVE